MLWRPGLVHWGAGEVARAGARSAEPGGAEAYAMVLWFTILVIASGISRYSKDTSWTIECREGVASDGVQRADSGAIRGPCG